MLLGREKEHTRPVGAVRKHDAGTVMPLQMRLDATQFSSRYASSVKFSEHH